MPFVTTRDEARLFFSDWGNPASPPVVFAHAWGLNGDMWNAQLPALLDAGFRCVTYDRRGHGRSDRPRNGYSLDSIADDLADLLSYLDLSGALLVGHSIGAAEVVRYLSRHGSGRTAGAILSAPCAPIMLRSPSNPDGIDESVFQAGRTAMCADIGAFVEATSASDYFGSTREVSEGLADWTRRQVISTPLPVLLETQQAFSQADLRNELSELRLPVLIIHGSADRATPLELTGQRTAALVPASRLVVIDGAGHGVYASDAARYNAELITFAQSLSASPISPELDASDITRHHPRSAHSGGPATVAQGWASASPAPMGSH